MTKPTNKEILRSLAYLGIDAIREALDDQEPTLVDYRQDHKLDDLDRFRGFVMTTLYTIPSGYSHESYHRASFQSPAFNMEMQAITPGIVSVAVKWKPTPATIGPQLVFGTVGAMEDAVLSVPGVERVQVTTDRPTKSFRVTIWPDEGIDEDEIARAIFHQMPAGVESAGYRSAAVEHEGMLQEVRWSYGGRPEEPSRCNSCNDNRAEACYLPSFCDAADPESDEHISCDDCDLHGGHCERCPQG